MERIKFNFTGGFPIKQRLFEKMQKSYFEVMQAFVGHLGLPDVGFFIINGCEVVGSNITPGKMYIDGDLCSFGGGVGDLTTKVKKIETIENAPFKNGNNNPVYASYEAKINTAGVALQDYIRSLKVPELENVAIDFDEILNVPNLVVDPFISNALTPKVVPQETLLQRIIELEKKNAIFTQGGGMVMWNQPANKIPENWYEVVDWKGRLPIGVDNRLDTNGQLLNFEFSPLTANGEPGRTNIGVKKVTLDLENIPAHDHKVKPYAGFGANNSLNINAPTNDPSSDTTSKAGGLPNGDTKPFDVLNPFRTVYFIEYIKP